MVTASPPDVDPEATCALKFALCCQGAADEGAPTAAPAADVTARVLRIFDAQCPTDADKAAVVFTVVFGSGFEYFADVNAAYVAAFRRTVPPPSRAFVGCGDAAPLRVTVVAVEDAHRASVRRDALHVQSISAWAAACIGPYAQSNTVRCDACGAGIVLTAGTLPLEPPTMVVAGSEGSRHHVAGAATAASDASDARSVDARARLFSECVMCIANAHAVLQQSAGCSEASGIAAARIGTVFFSAARLQSSEQSDEAAHASAEVHALEVFWAAWRFVAQRRAAAAAAAAAAATPRLSNSQSDSDASHGDDDVAALPHVVPMPSSIPLRAVTVATLPRGVAVELILGAVISEGDACRPCSCALVSVALPRFFQATVPQ